tara:strand:- start:4571 stop:4996 length:426 start_codon:yes stop_codon:yes gene_type:complete
MNKNELKKILKPLIKQCIKEVIFEDGTLSNIVSEVAMGLGSANVISEVQTSPSKTVKLESDAAMQARMEAKKASLRDQKKKMLDAIGNSAYNGVDLFEGTTPAPAPQEKGQGPLSGVDPSDPGVDITNFTSSAHWKKLAGN